MKFYRNFDNFDAEDGHFDEVGGEVCDVSMQTMIFMTMMFMMIMMRMNLMMIATSQVNLTLLVVAEVTPGLPTTCDVQVSVKVDNATEDNDEDAFDAYDAYNDNGNDEDMQYPHE